jgi:hypothetical protein
VSADHRVILARFEALVSPEPMTGCWLWTGKLIAADEPYGVAGGSKHRERAHRRAWRLYRGEIPGDLHVLHRCDVPWCVNPDHLFLGTNADNVADKIGKGRGWTPTDGREPTIPAATVTALRDRARRGEKVAALAREYGIGRQYAYTLIAGRARANV